MKFECCIETITEALIAKKYRADRVELCAALDIGGLTPSYGLIKAGAALQSPEVHVMIRPRGGNFIYSPDELSIMKEDIILAKAAGAKGVVFGVLDQNDNINEQAVISLADVALQLDLRLTFHRAFDQVSDTSTALQFLVSAGFHRILTSGGAKTALGGKTLLSQLASEANGKIEIMAGGGVSAANAAELLDAGVDALHFSIRKNQSTGQEGMGNDYTVDENKVTLFLSAVGKAGHSI